MRTGCLHVRKDPRKPECWTSGEVEQELSRIPDDGPVRRSRVISATEMAAAGVLCGRIAGEIGHCQTISLEAASPVTRREVDAP